MLSDHYFGDVEALDEGKNHSDYFDSTFIVPSSFSLSALNNRRNYLIVGRKGTGKTAVQFHFAKKMRGQGFLTHFFSFYSDLRPADYNDAAKTQKIDMLGISNTKNIFLNYDFRDVWQRTFLTKIAETLSESGDTSKFTSIATEKRGKLSSIFEGLLRSATIKVSADFGIAAGEIGVDLGNVANDEVSLTKYVQILRELLARYHLKSKMFLFVDELVFSRLDAADDEVRVRAAMVRDIFRVARDLNNYFAERGMDIHVICSVRPEIRDMINELDAEIGKIFDGKSVDLYWNITDDEDSALLAILKNKVKYSNPKIGEIDFEVFFSQNVTFNQRKSSIATFLATNTWGRPRDVVQLLLSIATRNPDARKITEIEIKNSLVEYSRRCFVELLDEVSVRHGPSIAQILKENIKKREFKSLAEFEAAVTSKTSDVNRTLLIQDLYNFGVIGNIDKSKRIPRYHWAHRGDHYLDPAHSIVVHSGLWHYLHIQ